MTREQIRSETVRLLQDLGLKEYEARSFLALTQVPSATAKEISDISEVPRTRVYDAVRVLEAEGLVEIQHSNPQQFRAVDIEEATATLREKYDTRIETLRSYVERIEPHEEDEEDDRMQEVWSLTGHEAIRSRTIDLVEEAESEIVLIVVDEDILTESLFERLHDARSRGVDLVVGGVDDAIVDRLRSELPRVEVFESELDWLVNPGPDEEVAISRLLLVDRETLLVSSFYPASGRTTETGDEHATFANGLGNGIVVLIRRLISTGLVRTRDPST